jgi:hypothetical protein
VSGWIGDGAKGRTSTVLDLDKVTEEVKRAAGRPRDPEAVAELQAIRDRRRARTSTTTATPTSTGTEAATASVSTSDSGPLGTPARFW